MVLTTENRPTTNKNFPLLIQLQFIPILARLNAWYVLFGVHRDDLFEDSWFIIKPGKYKKWNHSKHSICIHIDSKADPEFYDAMKFIANCFGNIFLAKKREDVVYTHFTMIKAFGWNILLAILSKHSRINQYEEPFQLHRTIIGPRLEIFH